MFRRATAAAREGHPFSIMLSVSLSPFDPAVHRVVACQSTCSACGPFVRASPFDPRVPSRCGFPFARFGGRTSDNNRVHPRDSASREPGFPLTDERANRPSLEKKREGCLALPSNEAAVATTLTTARSTTSPSRSAIAVVAVSHPARQRRRHCLS